MFELKRNETQAKQGVVGGLHKGIVVGCCAVANVVVDNVARNKR